MTVYANEIIIFSIWKGYPVAATARGRAQSSPGCHEAVEEADQKARKRGDHWGGCGGSVRVACVGEHRGRGCGCERESGENFISKNMNFVLTTDEFCIENDELCRRADRALPYKEESTCTSR